MYLKPLIDLIDKCEAKHHTILDEYSKGNANDEIMKMYRSQMKDLLEIIGDLKRIFNNETWK